MKQLFKCALITVTALLLGACSSPEIRETVAEEFSAQNLHPVSNTGFEEAFVLPGANLPGYASVAFSALQSAEVDIPQTTVSGTTRRDWQMTPQKEAQLADIWRQATSRAFAAYPQDGEGALEVSAALTRVASRRTASGAGAGAGAGYQTTGDVVEVSAEFRIHDASTGQLLAVVRDRRSIASLQWGRAAGVDLTNLFNSWASLLHTRVSGR